MPFELRIKDRKARVEILDQSGTVYKVRIDDRIYELDVTKVENGVYSIIHDGRSVNMQMIEGEAYNKYIVTTRSSDYDIEIVDAKTRYKEARQGDVGNSDTVISSPMPGKVVKLLINEGDDVSKGDTVIIVSAMKMESEYKSPIDGIVSKVLVKAEDTIEGNQPLVEIEPTE